MAVLGNKPPVVQNQGMNATNVGRAVAGYTPGQFYPAGSLYGQGLSFGTPRNWSQGGQQMYDPQYVRPLTQEGTTSGQNLSRGGQKPSSGGGMVGGTGWRFGAAMPGYQNQMGSIGQIGTSIQPQSIYDPWMTDVAVNQAVANADQRSNLQTLMGQFDTPGVSRSSRHAALAAPLAAQAQLTAADARARIPFEDTMANQRNLFLGQVARENEALGLGNLQARLFEAQNQDALSRLGTGLSYLQSLIG